MRAWWGVAAMAALVGGCGGEEPPPMSDASASCVAHGECDDGVFCNGAERCAPDDPAADPSGCVLGESPCAAEEACDEEMGRCFQDCGFAPDGDGDGHAAIGCGGDDCDDTDPRRFPGNAEVCDALDVDEDCDPRTFGDLDQDGDGDPSARCCNADPEGGASFCGVDCNDQRRDQRPGLPEVCDGLDNDCDGAVDEGVLVEGWVDADFDLHGDASMPVSSCPGLPGFSTVSDDCDDTDPARHGAQVEVCDEVDNDCDGITDESPASTTWYRDADDDGFGSAASGTMVSCVPPAGHVLRLGDCDDADRTVNPVATERCNGRDDDCNGVADFAIGGDPSDTEDDDGDGFADATCGGDDCDDADPDTRPDATELMDLADNDCDGTVDEAPGTVPWWIDRDGDGWGTDDEPSIEATERPAGRVSRAGDCDDGDASIHPGVPDGCDGVDADCDGVIDETAPRIAYYADGDGDGWGAGTEAVLACAAPPGTSDRPLDCDDADDTVFPGAAERCNGEDSDCDGTVDEASDRPWYPDMDGDGFGRSDLPLADCAPPTGYVPDGGDCDDVDGTVFPGSVEACDGIDQDCDSTVDETADAACSDLPGATGVCSAGECELTCDAGRGDCNGDVADGCETDTTRSATHCGGCFMACSPADTCGVTGTGCDEARIVQIVAGQDWTAVRRVGGRLAVWGRGSSGANGSGSAVDQLAPVLGVAPPLVDVDAGWNSGIGVTTDGRAFAWGENGLGQLGNGTTTDRPGGSYVRGLTQVVDASMGRDHACAMVREDDMGTPVQRVYCWGSDTRMQLGPGGTGTIRRTPLLVPGIDDAQSVLAGDGYSCVRRFNAVAGQRFQCWGWGGRGALGDGAGTDSRTPRTVDPLPPDVIDFVGGSGIRPCVRTASARVYCWGVAPGDGSGGANSPVVVSGIDDAIDATQGLCADPSTGGGNYAGTACVARDAAGVGQVWCWGHGALGTHGAGKSGGELAPVQVDVTAGTALEGVTMVAAGFFHACAVVESAGAQQVYCWGQNNLGQVGRGFTSTSATPAPVAGLP